MTNSSRQSSTAGQRSAPVVNAGVCWCARLRNVRRVERCRSGYTLLEMLLVLTVMMIIASLAASPLMSSWQRHRLSEAAESVRSLAAGTRILALDNGEHWQFRFEPGGTRFVRVPLKEVGDASQASGASQQQGVNGQLSGVLPEGIVFGEDMNNSSSADNLSSSQLAGMPDSGELGQVKWSSAIVFFGDGTASQTMFTVEDSENGGLRQISVRDLTGAVSATMVSE